MIFMHAEERLPSSLSLDLGIPGGPPLRSAPPTLLFPIRYDTLKVHHVSNRQAQPGWGGGGVGVDSHARVHSR